MAMNIKERVTRLNKPLEALSFFDQRQRAIKDLSKQSSEFLWFQLFKDLILRLPRNSRAKQDMVAVSRKCYHNDSKQLELIGDFEQSYQPEESIPWYTKQSFVYELVNAALRSEDIDQLHAVRFFVGDLSKSLVSEYQKLRESSEKTLTVFRGARLNTDEFDKIRQNEGKLISTNGFFSTSRRCSVALSFAEQDDGRQNVVPVLFIIQCNIEELGESVIFADIARFSKFPDEEEVLFDLSAVFQLGRIEQKGTMWLIHMNVSRDAHAITKDYIELQQEETEERSVAIVLGRLMFNMGQYEKSLKYFQQLRVDPNGEDLAWIEFNIGRAFVWKADWIEARKWFDSAYDRMMHATTPRTRDSAAVLRSIGVVLCNQKSYDEALRFLRRALAIQEEFYPSDHKDIAWNFNCMGTVLRAQGQHQSALDHYQRGLAMQKKLFPSDHVDIAWNLNNIGSIYYDQGKYEDAIDLHQRALSMQEKFCPASHPAIAWSLNSIGSIFREQGKYAEAADFYRRALAVYEKSYPSGHVKVADSLHNLGLVYLAQQQYERALDHLQKALQMKEKFQSTAHYDVARILADIGNAYESIQNPEMALNHYKRALAIFEETVPTENPDRQKTEQRIRQLGGKRPRVRVIECYTST